MSVQASQRIAQNQEAERQKLEALKEWHRSWTAEDEELLKCVKEEFEVKSGTVAKLAVENRDGDNSVVTPLSCPMCKRVFTGHKRACVARFQLPSPHSPSTLTTARCDCEMTSCGDVVLPYCLAPCGHNACWDCIWAGNGECVICCAAVSGIVLNAGLCQLYGGGGDVKPRCIMHSVDGNGMPIDYLCLSDNSLICVKCAVDSHTGTDHSVLKLCACGSDSSGHSDACGMSLLSLQASSLCDELKAALKRAQSTLSSAEEKREAMLERKSSLIVSFEKRMNDLIALIEAHKAKVVGELTAGFDEGLGLLAAQINLLLTNVAQLSAVVTMHNHSHGLSLLGTLSSLKAMQGLVDSVKSCDDWVSSVPSSSTCTLISNVCMTECVESALTCMSVVVKDESYDDIDDVIVPGLASLKASVDRTLENWKLLRTLKLAQIHFREIAQPSCGNARNENVDLIELAYRVVGIIECELDMCGSSSTDTSNPACTHQESYLEACPAFCELFVTAVKHARDSTVVCNWDRITLAGVFIGTLSLIRAGKLSHFYEEICGAAMQTLLMLQDRVDDVKLLFEASNVGLWWNNRNVARCAAEAVVRVCQKELSVSNFVHVAEEVTGGDSCTVLTVTSQADPSTPACQPGCGNGGGDSHKSSRSEAADSSSNGDDDVAGQLLQSTWYSLLSGLLKVIYSHKDDFIVVLSAMKAIVAVHSLSATVTLATVGDRGSTLQVLSSFARDDVRDIFVHFLKLVAGLLDWSSDLDIVTMLITATVSAIRQAWDDEELVVVGCEVFANVHGWNGLTGQFLPTHRLSVFATLVELLKTYQHHDDIVNSLLTVVTNMTGTDLNCFVKGIWCTKLHVTDVLMSALHRHISDEDVQLAAWYAAGRLCGLLVDTGLTHDAAQLFEGLQQVVDAHVGSRKVQTAWLGSPVTVVMDPTTCLGAVVRAMDIHIDDVNIQELGANSIGSIARRLGPSMTEEDVHCMVTRLFAAIDRYTANADLQTKAFASLESIASSSVMAAGIIFRNGGLPRLRTAIRSHPDIADVLTRALAVMSHIVGFTEIDALCELVPDVLSAMDSHVDHVGLQEHGCKVVTGLSNPVEVDSAEYILASGVLVRVIAAMRNNLWNVALQVQACKTLVALTTNEQCRNSLMELGALLRVFEALDRHATVFRVQDVGCASLGHLASSPVTAGVIIAEGGLHRIVRALDRHNANADVQRSACHCLWKIITYIPSGDLLVSFDTSSGQCFTSQARCQPQTRPFADVAAMASTNRENASDVRNVVGLERIQRAQALFAPGSLSYDLITDLLTRLLSLE